MTTPNTSARSWVAATSLRNFILQDLVVDWFLHHHARRLRECPSYAALMAPAGRRHKDKGWTPGGDPPPSVRRRPVSPAPFLMSQGLRFEEKVVNDLFARFGSEVLRDVGGCPDATAEAFRAEHPLIYQAFVSDPQTRTFGTPDLLVRRDWLPRLGARVREDDPRPGYRVVDIKSSRLPLRSDGIHLRTTPSVSTYKTQLYVYNQGLGALQGYTPRVAYLLGKGWKYTSKGQSFQDDSCYSRLAEVDFAGVDEGVSSAVSDGLAWIDRVRSEGSSWNPLRGGELTELCPNMNNRLDYPWRQVKRILAEERGEITTLWRCGPRQRKRAQDRGVFSWTDPRFSAELAGFAPGAGRRTLDRMLEVNRTRVPSGVLPAHLSVPFCGLSPLAGEVFVDFETINLRALDDVPAFPNATQGVYIFLVGVVFQAHPPGVRTRAQRKRASWTYRSFVLSHLTANAQESLYAEFTAFLLSHAAANGVRVEDVPFFHWGHAEPALWKKVYPHGRRLRWVDLLVGFRKEPVVVRGSFSYSLKDVANALRRLGHITAHWEGDAEGLGAQLEGHAAYEENARRRLPVTLATSPRMKRLAAYNETDCRVVMEILRFLRTRA